MSGFRSEFDRALEAIEAKVIELFAMVAEGLPAATQALMTGRGDTVRVLADREQIVDALYLEAEELAGQQILRQAPVASDLRFLLSVLRIVPELERSHDLIVEIASRAGRVDSQDLPPDIRSLASQAGELACGMWRQAADAWYNRDPSALLALSERQERMTELHASLAAELAAGQMAMPGAMEMTLIGRCYERLGAHAVNLARRVTYLAGPTSL
jgi:phosphate transport system protein